MRLLRMTTVDPSCIFDETLHQDITLSPNSSIALKNLTLEADTSLTVNGSNDNITYELTAGNPNVAYLTHRTYTKYGSVTLDSRSAELQRIVGFARPNIHIVPVAPV